MRIVLKVGQMSLDGVVPKPKCGESCLLGTNAKESAKRRNGELDLIPGRAPSLRTRLARKDLQVESVWLLGERVEFGEDL